METEIKEQLNRKTEPLKAKVCCGGEPKNKENACCKLDETKKAEGKAGCGCNTGSNAGCCT